MELRVLEYFLAVTQEQSISAAAEYLNLTQPTISRQLKDLEEELGKQLLVRGKRNHKIGLTEEGRLFRKRAQEIVELVQKTENEIRQSGHGIAGDIFIGAGETDALRVIARVAHRIQIEYPDVHIHIVSGDGQDLMDRLDKGLFDFGLLLGTNDSSKYEQLPLPMRDHWGVLMRKDAPLAAKERITPQDLWEQPLILSRQMIHFSNFLQWMQKPLSELQISATYNLAYNASLMADEKMGYVLTLDKLINTSGDSNLCFRPLEPDITLGMSLVWKRYAVLSKSAEYFLSQLRAEIASS